MSVGRMSHGRVAEYWVESQECCDPAWEEAYARFETSAQETEKFLGRLRGFGVERWHREAQIVEIFCGRGGGLDAWHQLGFQNLEGVDLSAALLQRYRGKARLYVGDCRQLKLANASRDVVCVQGGLHHLPLLPADLRATVREVHRVLKPGGHFLVVEPWLTPFLHAVHAACRQSWVRRASMKFDALACMIEHEQKTYFNWLARPREIERELADGFQTESSEVRWGKLSWLGRKPW